MSETSLNIGLELDDQPVLADTPPNTEIAGVLDTKKEILVHNGSQDNLVSFADEIRSSLENLDIALDLRNRLVSLSKINKDLALEALDIDPDMRIKPINSYTTELTKTNYQFTLESVDTYINKVINDTVNNQLSSFTEATSEKSNQILIKEPNTALDRLSDFKDNVVAYINGSGLNAFAGASVNPTASVELSAIVNKSSALTKLINSPSEIKNIICQITDKLLPAAKIWEADYVTLKSKLLQELKSGDSSSIDETLQQLKELTSNVSTQIDFIPLYSAVGYQGEAEINLNNVNTLVTSLREYGRGKYQQYGFDLLESLYKELTDVASTSSTLTTEGNVEAIEFNIQDVNKTGYITQVLCLCATLNTLVISHLCDKVTFLNDLFCFLDEWIKASIQGG
ncbi:MAG: hypothetical protein M0R77_01060 [Gammaproteobacteria bacterium]|nr:hypothetical protein [Acholeplasmataceae bacterium]MCK9529145.1 hypothetical protein [Gammaproteobacteria bacterium]